MGIAEETGINYMVALTALKMEPAIPFLRPGWHEIREVAAANPQLSQKEIARQFEVGHSTVRFALNAPPQIIMLRKPVPQTQHSQRVMDIRNFTLTQPHLTQEEIAEKMGTNRWAIWHALSQEPRISLEEIPPEQQLRRVFTPEQREEVRQFVAANLNMTKGELIAKYGITFTTLQHILGDELWNQLPQVHGHDWAGYSAEFRAKAVNDAVVFTAATLQEIAESYNVTLDTIRRWMRDAGVQRGVSKVNPPDVIDFIEQNPTMRPKDIIAHFGISRETLRRIRGGLGTYQRYRRQTPSAELGVFNTPEYYDPLIQEYRFYEYGPLDEDDSPYIDAYEHTGTDVSGEGELLDDEVYHYEDMGKQEFLSGETPQSHAEWDIDDVKVEIDYGPWTSRLGERIDYAAWVSIERYGGRPFDSYMFTPGGPIAQVTDLLDQVHAKNPGIRIVATATQDPEGRGDLRARAYERYGWKRISGTDASGGVDMELPPPDQRTPRTPRTPNSFDGIDRYADAIMELV